jgi:S1-C subfamily serine protease
MKPCHTMYLRADRLKPWMSALAPLLIGLLLATFIAGCGQSDGAVLPSDSSPQAAAPGGNVVSTAAQSAYPAPTQNVVSTAAQPAYPAPTQSDYPPPSRPTPGLAVTVESIPAPSVLGVVIDQDMQVLHVEPDSAAERATIQVGDILETIEGVPFATERRRAKQMIWHNHNQQPLNLKLKRNAEELLVTVIPLPPNFARTDLATPRQLLPTATPVWPPYDYF